MVWVGNEGSKDDWFRNIIGIECLKNHDNILCAWLYGCESYEDLSDQVVMKDCVKVLKQFLARDDIPEPVKLIRYFKLWYFRPNEVKILSIRF